jgi:Arc/MetJ-type ribon-helix-helix transcriptional regulator
MYARMSEAESNDQDPEIDRINLRISRSFLEVVDEAWRERGFNSRSEYIRYALREAVNHPEGAGFWKDLAISEAQFDRDGGIPSEEVKEQYGLDGE